MEIVYFHSDTHPYEKAIYPGVGPAFAKPLGWRTEKLSRLSQAAYDVAVVDNRLEPGDVTALKAFLVRPARSRQPLFFRISDPEMPLSDNPQVQFIFQQRDTPGVHYATTYDPAGPFLDFTRSLRASRVVHLPFAYDASREVEVDLASRQRRLFLSGAHNGVLYPVRYRLRRRRRWNPLLRFRVYDLRHPGYPEQQTLRHNITHGRFVDLASRFTHFFLCRTRYDIEIMKFVECAYAGSVPVGVPAASIRAVADGTFRRYSGRVTELVADLDAQLAELQQRAAEYRRRMRALRDPEVIKAAFEAQVRAVID